MDLLEKKIVADLKRRGAIMNVDYVQDDPIHGCQGVFHLLYVNRGRTLWDAMQDAEHLQTLRFMEKLNLLFERGLVEVYDDHIYLPLHPETPNTNAINRLANVASKPGRWRPEQGAED